MLFILLIIGSTRFSLQIFKILTLKQFLLFGAIAIAGYSIITYYNYKSQTESFRQGLELLKSNKRITDEIGYFESVSYFSNDMPNEKDDPAILRLSLKGDKAEVYLRCTIKKGNSDNWHLTEIKQDSLNLNKEP